jgi:AraC-like DNA-binding protein
MQYLAEWRLQIAAELLQETKLGVSAVAYRVGYESEAAFNRAFKRAMGKPPAQWRTSVLLSSKTRGLMHPDEDHMDMRGGAARAVRLHADRQ